MHQPAEAPPTEIRSAARGGPLPTYSVVMPAYNVEAYIDEAVESVLRQTTPDWELVIVDDGSTDRTPEIVASYQDPRIRHLRQPNSGISATRNRGLAAVRGKYVVFFDSDDRLVPDAIDRLGRPLERDGRAVLSYGEAVVMDDAGRLYGPDGGPVFAPRPSGDVLGVLLRRNFMLPGAAMIRADPLVKIGGFDEQLTRSEDWEMLCRLALEGDFVYIGKRPVLHYRIRSNSISRTDVGTVGFQEMLKVMNVVYGNPRIRRLFSPAQWRRLRKAREASAYSRMGSELLRARQWSAAGHYLRESLRRAPFSPREVAFFAAACLRWLPPILAKHLK